MPLQRRARTDDSLTDREIQILALVAAGEPTHAISRRLGITENTVKSHLTRVYKKTGSLNRVQAARHYLDHYTTHPGEPLPPPVATDRRRRAGEPAPLIRRQIQELEARLEQLAPATTEAENIQHALDALRAIEPIKRQERTSSWAE